MFKNMIEKAYAVKAEGFLQHYREAFKNASGAVSIAMLAGEAISILILIVILVLIPLIGDSIGSNLPAINESSPWATYASSGADMWGQVQPLLIVCVVVCLVGLVLKVIYDLKNNR